MDYAISFALFLPLMGFLTLIWCQTCSRKSVVCIGCTTILLSFLTFAALLVHAFLNEGAAISTVLYRWIPVAGIDADFALYLDNLSLCLALVITGVGLLIHVYSIGYMDHEKDYARYFACLNLFVFAMLLLVLAKNLVLLFMGWEGVGLASYLLIGFWYERKAAAAAATKAFVVNRIGDFGFLLGIVLAFYLFGTSDIGAIFEKIAAAPPEMKIMTLLTALLFIGAIGKSAQLPLHVWLPDAMEGPTPVSALIHAATMVTAGVYLVVRLHPLFEQAPHTLYAVGVVGGATALFAALAAIGQSDLKRVLAYSTISQLGFMFLACGARAYYAAIFHLVTHAFMKGLLFLSAGNVVHMLGGKTEMGEMGGLAKVFTKTHLCFLVGVLAMSGVPPLAAFFSKDLILEQEYMAGYKVLFYIALLTSFLTGFYLMRAYCLTFTGDMRKEGAVHSHSKEAPPVMLWPVGILALLSLFGGALGAAYSGLPPLESFLAKADVDLSEGVAPVQFLFSNETWASIAVALSSVGISYFVYRRNHDSATHPVVVLKNAFYVNDIYHALFVVPYRAIAHFIASFMEPVVFNGSIISVGQATTAAATFLQKFQSGQIREYAAWMVCGMLLFLASLLLTGTRPS